MSASPLWLVGGLLAVVVLVCLVKAARRSSPDEDLPYEVLLQDPRWKSLSRQVQAEAGYRCAMCPARSSQTHHKGYMRRNGKKVVPWDEEYIRRGWLVPLCAACHSWYEFGKRADIHEHRRVS